MEVPNTLHKQYVKLKTSKHIIKDISYKILTNHNYFRNSNILIECLVPDFQGDTNAVKTIVDSQLDVYAHNIETVESLTPYVRDRRARYR